MLQWVVLAVFFLQGIWDQGTGFVVSSYGFWFQESSLLLFSVPILFYQYLVLYAGKRIAWHIRDLDELEICIMGDQFFNCFCTWNCWQWTPVLCWPFCNFFQFGFATWGLWWWWFLDPAVDLFSATVDWTCYSCFSRSCVRCALHNIYQHWNSLATCWLSHNKFIDIFL